MPGFTAAASLGPATTSYRSAGAFGAAGSGASSAVAAQSSALTNRHGAGFVGLIGGGTANFRCSSHSCRCWGVDDCVDLFVNTDLCGDYITCDFSGDPVCYCLRKGQ